MHCHTFPGDAFTKLINADLDGQPVRCLELPLGKPLVVLGPDVVKAIQADGRAPLATQNVAETLRASGVDGHELLRLRWRSRAAEGDRPLTCSAVFVTLKGLSQAFEGVPVTLIDPYRPVGPKAA